MVLASQAGRHGDTQLLREERASLLAQVATHAECVRTVEASMEADAHTHGDWMNETHEALQEGTRMLQEQVKRADEVRLQSDELSGLQRAESPAGLEAGA